MTLLQARKDIKESYLVDTAEYDVGQDIYHEPSFNWWVNSELKKRLRIISLVKKMNARYLKKTHNFGIEVTKSVAQAYAMDKNNGNILWVYSIAK